MKRSPSPSATSRRCCERSSETASGLRGRTDDLRPYTRDELKRLLAVTRARSRADFLVLLLCARCGLRRSEAIGLCWADFNGAARSVSLRRKASKPRNLRHTYASELLARGADLSQVAKLLGDTLAVTEDCYAHLVQSRRLRALVDSLSEEI